MPIIKNALKSIPFFLIRSTAFSKSTRSRFLFIVSFKNFWSPDSTAIVSPEQPDCFIASTSVEVSLSARIPLGVSHVMSIPRSIIPVNIASALEGSKVRLSSSKKTCFTPYVSVRYSNSSRTLVYDLARHFLPETRFTEQKLHLNGHPRLVITDIHFLLVTDRGASPASPLLKYSSIGRRSYAGIGSESRSVITPLCPEEATFPSLSL